MAVLLSEEKRQYSLYLQLAGKANWISLYSGR